MTDAIAGGLRAHLLREDGQEDVCLATYRPSTGTARWTALLRDIQLPREGERDVHGNVSFTGDYVLRVAMKAALADEGVVVIHSHPQGRGWQEMSSWDADAEGSYAYLVREITGLPLLGMTLAGRDLRWSARVWDESANANSCESVRVVGASLVVSWNEDVRPRPAFQQTQSRTLSGWGESVQADIARLRVLVVGTGSVGLEVGRRLGATGIEHIGVMDFDTVELVNLDRLLGASELDALLHRRKVDVARRVVRAASTSAQPEIVVYDQSVCEESGHRRALDYDLIVSCVDRPWPRAVLNMIAYSDLIPVIDGGIHIDAFPDGGMRNATWRSHVIRPGRPCLVCNRQLELGDVSVDRAGLLSDPEYIRGANLNPPSRQNVAALSVAVTSSILALFVSLAVGPGGQGEPGPLRYVLSTHMLEHPQYETRSNCYFENSVATGDQRLPLTGRDRAAERARAQGREADRSLSFRLLRMADGVVELASHAVLRVAAQVSASR
jgi:hypothetical protein